MISVALIGVGIINAFLAMMALNRVKTFQKSITNITFTVFTAFVVIWSLSTALLFAGPEEPTRELVLRINAIAQTAIATYYFVFSFFFPSYCTFRPSKIRKIILSQILLITYILFVIVDGITSSGAANSSLMLSGTRTVGGLLYQSAYIIILGTFFYSASLRIGGKLRNVRHRLKHAGVSITRGLRFSILISLVTNIIAPAHGATEFMWLGPLSTLLYLIPLFQAVTRYRLFDIRGFAVTSLVYASATLVAALIYAAIASVLLGEVTDHTSIGARSFVIAAAVLIGFTFHFGRRVIAHLIRKFIYRNSISRHEAHDALIDLLLKEIRTNKIIAGSLDIINKTMKPEGVTLAINGSDQPHHSGHIGVRFDAKSQVVRSLLRKRNTIVVTEIFSEKKKDALITDGIELILRIYSARKSTIAVLILGPKRNGRHYNQSDIAYLKKIAKSLSIALESALNYEQVVNFNKTLIDEVEKATRSLQRANEKLKKHDDDKNEFLSMAAHQLKPQLSAARGFNELIGDTKLGKEQQELTSLTSVSIERMVRIVSDMLNLSRFGDSRVVLNPHAVDLSRLVELEVNRLKNSASNRNQTLQSTIETGIWADIDETKIKETVMNFIDNAIYYSPSDERIVVNLSRDEEAITFTVTDNGIGVPKREQSRLFRKFSRASNARNKRPSGTGVGLFMAKKFIAAHKGTIIFESVENQGSTFGFSLPVKMSQ